MSHKINQTKKVHKTKNQLYLSEIYAPTRLNILTHIGHDNTDVTKSNMIIMSSIKDYPIAYPLVFDPQGMDVYASLDAMNTFRQNKDSATKLVNEKVGSSTTDASVKDILATELKKVMHVTKYKNSMGDSISPIVFSEPHILEQVLLSGVTTKYGGTSCLGCSFFGHASEGGGRNTRIDENNVKRRICNGCGAIVRPIITVTNRADSYHEEFTMVAVKVTDGIVHGNISTSPAHIIGNMYMMLPIRTSDVIAHITNSGLLTGNFYMVRFYSPFTILNELIISQPFMPKQQFNSLIFDGFYALVPEDQMESIVVGNIFQRTENFTNKYTPSIIAGDNIYLSYTIHTTSDLIGNNKSTTQVTPHNEVTTLSATCAGDVLAPNVTYTYDSDAKGHKIIIDVGKYVQKHVLFPNDKSLYTWLSSDSKDDYTYILPDTRTYNTSIDIVGDKKGYCGNRLDGVVLKIMQTVKDAKDAAIADKSTIDKAALWLSILDIMDKFGDTYIDPWNEMVFSSLELKTMFIDAVMDAIGGDMGVAEQEILLKKSLIINLPYFTRELYEKFSKNIISDGLKIKDIDALYNILYGSGVLKHCTLSLLYTSLLYTSYSTFTYRENRGIQHCIPKLDAPILVDLDSPIMDIFTGVHKRELLGNAELTYEYLKSPIRYLTELNSYNILSDVLFSSLNLIKTEGDIQAMLNGNWSYSTKHISMDALCNYISLLMAVPVCASDVDIEAVSEAAYIALTKDMEIMAKIKNMGSSVYSLSVTKNKDKIIIFIPDSLGHIKNALTFDKITSIYNLYNGLNLVLGLSLVGRNVSVVLHSLFSKEFAGYSTSIPYVDVALDSIFQILESKIGS